MRSHPTCSRLCRAVKAVGMFCGGHRGLAVGTHAREQVEGRKIDRSPTFSRAGAAAIHKMWVHQLRLYKSSRPVHTHGINAERGGPSLLANCYKNTFYREVCPRIDEQGSKQRRSSAYERKGRPHTVSPSLLALQVHVVPSLLIFNGLFS